MLVRSLRVVAFLFAALAGLAAQGATYQYVYDALGRLTSVIDDDGVATEYAYDEVGNVLSVTRRSVAALSIVSFSPASGPVGISVTIVGTGFDLAPAANAVSIGGAPATVTSATARSLVVVVPAAAASGPITVTNSRGSVTSATPFTVTALGPPSISNVTPSIGVPGGTFTVSGQNFEPGTAGNQVRVNQASTAVQSAAPDVITASIPLASGGKVRVTTPRGTATSSSDLFIAPPPRVASDFGATGRIVIGAETLPFALAASKAGLFLVDGEADEDLRVFVPVANIPGGYTISAYGVDGTLLSTSPVYAATSPGSLRIAPLALAGSYSVVVAPAGTSGGSGTLAVLRDTTLISGVRRDWILTNPSLEIGRFWFDAAAGDEPYLAVGEITTEFAGGFAVYAPSGAIVSSGNYFPDMLRQLPPLPTTGAYLVELDPFGGTLPGKVELLLRNIPRIELGTLASDVAVPIQYTSDLQVARGTFAASAGAVVGIRVSGVTFPGNGTYVIVGPAGQTIESGTLTTAGLALVTAPLPTTGVYRIDLKSGSGAGTATITLRADAFIELGVLAIDTPKAVTFTKELQTARATFASIAGAGMGVAVFDAAFSGNGTLRVVRPEGSLNSTITSFAPPRFSIRLSPVPTGGVHTIYTSSGTSAGAESVVAWRDVEGGALQVDGAARDATVLYAAQQARFTFEGVAGATVSVGLQAMTFAQASVFVRAPNGSGAGSGIIAAPGGSVRLSALSQNGTYEVIVTPSGNATGSLSARVFTDLLVPMALDETRDITIAIPGQTARITFSGNAGELAGATWSNVTFPSGGTFNVQRPDGGFFVFNTGVPAAGTFSRFGALPQTGTYTLTFTPAGGAAGSVRLALWREAATPIVLDADSPQVLSVPNSGQRARFTFAGTAGTSIGIEIGAVALSGGGGTFFVTRPDGGIFVFNTGFTSTGLVHRAGALPQTGTYTAEVTPGANGIGTFAVRVWSDVSEGPVILGESRDIVITKPGQVARVTFSASAGDLLGLQWSAVTFSGTSTYFAARPDGGLFVANTAVPPAGLSTRAGSAPQTGLYTVTLTPSSNGTGSVRFAPWKDFIGTLVLATPLQVTLPFRAQQARLGFAGTAGDALSLTFAAVTFPSGGTFHVLSPTNQLVVGTTSFPAGGATIALPVLPSTGTYQVIVIPGAEAAGAATVTLQTR